ncbi:mitochondrial 54S ribosomal protein mL53 [Magnusiomyces paraingens]|uniref:Large ribosomal subunit protein mL53 n=1 Tax=Magnusiomyces paraingens TaxID=2606893 RepID=A0A5E8C3N1_9ASCO|nr:uncharacterized protein SAPINGB_P005791 [Saprochaete ingens]VVT57630.1 unnamed protein product [Saprochaete ingens]
MITKYFAKVSVSFNPLVAAAKPARVFLSNIPPKSRNASIALTQKILAPSSTEPSVISVTFKDGNVISLDPTQNSTVEVAEAFDRYSRVLKLKDDISEE